MKHFGFYDITPLVDTDCDYYVGIGERSNGKSFSVKEIILNGIHTKKVNISGYIDSGYQIQAVILRRWNEDFKGLNGANYFDDLPHNELRGNLIEKWTKGKWTDIYYYSQRWYLCKYENNERIVDETPFCYALSITSNEHFKGIQFPKVRIILFDEFLTNGLYVPDEFIKFQNTLSTIIRYRDNVKIFMMANTIDKYNNPYFTEMGLNNIRKMKKGDIDIYTYGESSLRVAVNFTDSPIVKKKSNKYFAFNNPKLNMIKNGAWDIGSYPHLPHKYKPNEVIYVYYVCYQDTILQCNIVLSDNDTFTFIHRKTTPIKDDESNIIYQQDFDSRPNYKRKIIYANSNIEKKIVWYYKNEKVFYQDNECGEIMRAYIEWCRNSE